MIQRIPETTQLELEQETKMLRGKLLIGEETPIGNDLPLVLQRLDIILLEYPIPRKGSDSFSAIFCNRKVDEQDMFFIGVNSWDYYDRQLFAIAHEIYHYLHPTVPHISREIASQNSTEQRADWFAAELLLPLRTLKSQIVQAFGKTEISELPFLTLLRFIARIQCIWWIPFKSIVHRLYEANAVNDSIYQKLFALDERKDDVYIRIGKATSAETFQLLNTRTLRQGTDSINLEPCLRNYEDGIITEEELYDGLMLFHRNPQDFGISFGADDDEEDVPESGGADYDS